MQKAKEHEEFVASKLCFDGASRSKSSGSSFHDPIDITSKFLVIECEYTEKESYRITKKLWKEIRMKAYGLRFPVIAFRFREQYTHQSLDLVTLSLDDFCELLRCYGEHWTRRN